MTRTRWTVVFLVLGIGVAQGHAGEEPGIDVNQPAYTRPDAAGRLWGHLEAFQKIGPRPVGSDAILAAGRYYADQMKALGYDVREQDFKDPHGAPGANWIADDKILPSQPFLIVAAHLDTVAKSPGANDDASGVSALIEAAAEIRQLKTHVPVRFVVFGAEEDFPGYGYHYGAFQYLDNLPGPERSQITGVIYLERVGRGDHLLIKRTFNRDPSLAKHLQPVAYRMLGQPSDITRIWKLGMSPFNQYLIPVAHVEWASSPDTHRPSDTLDRIQVQRILQTVGVVTAFLASPPQ